MRATAKDIVVDFSKLRARRDSLRSKSHAANTVRVYSSDMEKFGDWCRSTGRDAVPCSAETLLLYVIWLLDADHRISTASHHVAAILDSHRRNGHAVPSTAEVRQVISSVRRERRERPRGKLALSVEDLVTVAEACDPVKDSGVRDRALIVLGFATSLRRSELASLRLTDIAFEDDGLAVLVRHSKTDQEGRGRVIGVWPGERESTDPVRTLRAWIERRGNWDGPLFAQILNDRGKGEKILRKGFGGETVIIAVKRAIRRAGIDPGRYGAHSLRAGAITAAAELGRSDQEIMALSGHQSAGVMKMYVRRARVFGGRNPLAGLL